METEKEITCVAEEYFDYNDFVIPDKSELLLKATVGTPQPMDINDWPKETTDIYHKYEKTWKSYINLMVCVKTSVNDDDFFFERNCGRHCSLVGICSNIAEPTKTEVNPVHGAMLIKAAEHGESLLAEKVAGHRIGLQQNIKPNALKLTGRLDYKCYKKINIPTKEGTDKQERNCSHVVLFNFTVREHPRACNVFELLLKTLAGQSDRAFLLFYHASDYEVKLYELNMHGYANDDIQSILEQFKERVKIENMKERYYQLAFVETEDASFVNEL